MPATYSAYTGLRQHPPAPKAPEPEPVKKRHQGGMSAERLASMEEKKAKVRDMWPTHTIEQIQSATGYDAKSTIHKIARELGLPHKGRGGRR